MSVKNQQLAELPYQTPFFLCDNAKAVENFRILQKLLPQFSLHYALKVNSDLRLLAALYKAGSKFEIASLGELELLEKQQIPIEEVIYSNPVKPPAFIQAAFDKGIHFFTFDSINELEKFAKYAPGSNVILRYTTNDRGATFPLSRKFGAELQDIVPLMSFARDVGLRPYGLTFHVGSQALDPQSWELALKLAGSAINELERVGIKLEAIDIGGGFPVQYTGSEPSIQAISQVIQDSVKKFIPSYLKLIAEPGRFVAAPSAILITSVIGRTVHNGKNWLYLDAGAFHGLMESLESGNTMKYPIKTSIDDRDREMTQFTLTGPTCDPQDTICYDVLLPSNLMIGDKIYFLNTGAYCSTYATHFNGFLPPRNIFVEDMDARFFT